MDMSSPHGHPTARRLSEPPTHQSVHRRQPPYPSSTFTPSPQHEVRANPNQRRLQLRNSAFGAHLSAQRLGARFSSIFHGNEESEPAPTHHRHQENKTPHRASLRSTRSTYSLNSSVGILNEISNSSRIPTLRKRASIPIYEDSPERPLLERSPATPSSQYHDASSTIESPLSPLGLSYIQENCGEMRLREVSGNERRSSPSLSSPFTSTTGKGRRRTMGMRRSSFEATEYIDHIEKQLEQVKQAMHSPRSGKPVHEKMRALKAENARLQQTLDDLESSFEARLKSSVEHMTAWEGELQRKVKLLEEDVKARDLRIEELEYDHDQARLDQGSMDALRATIDRLEGEKRTLEDANSSIEKRNQILTEMLAFSPTKQRFELASPQRIRGRPSRPVSVMGSLIRFPSPTPKHSSRPSSQVNSPAVPSPGGYFSPRNVLELELQHPCNDADSGLGESCSDKSPIIPRSRRSTLQSQRATSPTAWGLPLPVSPVETGDTIRPAQKRKPRRFMTGSTQLKPLLLPSMAAESAILASPKDSARSENQGSPTPASGTGSSDFMEGSLTSSPQREVSHNSIDPTISFLSNPVEDYGVSDETSPSEEPSSSPPHLSKKDACSFTSNQSTSLASELEDVNFLHNGFIEDIESETGVEDEGSDFAASPERRSLFGVKQLQQPQSVLATPSPSDDISSWPTTQESLMTKIEALMQTSSPKIEQQNSSPNPRKRRRTSHSAPMANQLYTDPVTDRVSTSAGDLAILTTPPKPPDVKTAVAMPPPDPTPIATQYRPDLNPISLAARAANQRTVSPSITPKRLSLNTTPLELLQRQSASSSPLTAVTIRSIYGTISRYTTYIREFRRDPLALARRVIVNAWSSNWRRFGRLSWWVLGVFLPGGSVDHAQSNAWDWDHYDGAAVADRICDTQIRNTDPAEAPKSVRSSSPGKRSVRFEDEHDQYRTQGSKVSAKPVLKNLKEKPPGFGKSLYLWGKFSVAIMLAVGGAVWKGPGEMLKDCDMHSQSRSRQYKTPDSVADNGQHEFDDDETSGESSAGSETDGKEEPNDRDSKILPPTWFDFPKSATSPSAVFTFDLPTIGKLQDDPEDDPDPEQDLHHKPDSGPGEVG